jgi:hypothetical protein
MRNRGIESVSLKEPNKVMIFDYDCFERRWIYGSVHIDGVFIAQVCSVEYFREFSEHDKKVVECLCVITKFFIEHNHIFHSSEHIKMEYLMNRVLANEKVPVEQLKEQMPYINWNGSISHYVAVIAPSATADT